jgi:hypothetical protein
MTQRKENVFKGNEINGSRGFVGFFFFVLWKERMPEEKRGSRNRR